MEEILGEVRELRNEMSDGFAQVHEKIKSLDDRVARLEASRDPDMAGVEADALIDIRKRILNVEEQADAADGRQRSESKRMEDRLSVADYKYSQLSEKVAKGSASELPEVGLIVGATGGPKKERTLLRGGPDRRLNNSPGHSREASPERYTGPPPPMGKSLRESRGQPTAETDHRSVEREARAREFGTIEAVINSRNQRNFREAPRRERNTPPSHGQGRAAPRAMRRDLHEGGSLPDMEESAPMGYPQDYELAPNRRGYGPWEREAEHEWSEIQLPTRQYCLPDGGGAPPLHAREEMSGYPESARRNEYIQEEIYAEPQRSTTTGARPAMAGPQRRVHLQDGGSAQRYPPPTAELPTALNAQSHANSPGRPEQHTRPESQWSEAPATGGMKPPAARARDFYGKSSTEWRSYIKVFERQKSLFNMGEEECLWRLCNALRDKAAEYYSRLPERDVETYEKLKAKLEERYANEELPAIQRRTLRHMRQKEDESLQEYADRVLDTASEAFANREDMIDLMAVEAFLAGISNREVAFPVMNMTPQTLEKALAHTKMVQTNLDGGARKKSQVRAVQFTEPNRPPSNSPSRPVGYTEKDLSKAIEEMKAISEKLGKREVDQPPTYNEGRRPPYPEGQRRPDSPYNDRQSRYRERGYRNQTPPRYRSPAGEYRYGNDRRGARVEERRPRVASPACYSCGSESHFARECPSRRRSPSPGCYQCGDTSHYARECPVGRDPREGVGRQYARDAQQPESDSRRYQGGSAPGLRGRSPDNYGRDSSPGQQGPYPHVQNGGPASQGATTPTKNVNRLE